MLILAHRGLPGIDSPENTLAAVIAAYACGADGVEVDLRLTADGVLALSHDADLHRLTGVPIRVADAPWPALLEHAARRGVRLARAEDVLLEAGDRRLVLELKQPPPGTPAELTAEAAGALLNSLPSAGATLDVTVSSFSPEIVRTVRALLPPGGGVRTALLGLPKESATALFRQALEDGHDEMHPHVSSVTADEWIIPAAHAHDLAVVPWTVNRRRDVRRLAALGADALITDVPATARAAASLASV